MNTKEPSYKDLVQKAFGMPDAIAAKPSALPPKAIQPAEPVQPTRGGFDPGTIGAVQSFVWKDGNPPPPKAPTVKAAGQGTAPAMKQDKGWGQV